MMNLKSYSKRWLIFSALLLSASMKAQERPKILTDIESEGTIVVEQPLHLESLLSAQIASNALQKGVPGWRIRIFSKSGQTARHQALSVQASFNAANPDIKAYLSYNDPNYQIFVGDFRTKTEALFHKKQIARKYDKAFIVHSIINVNPDGQ